MAPKAAKRVSTGAASKSKRARGTQDIGAKCKQVADALDKATVFPASVMKMLSACLVPAMSAYKEDRHEQQTQVVAWIGEALVGLDAKLEEAKAEANSNLEAAQADLGLREAAVTEQEKTLKDLEEAAEAASTAKTEAENVLGDAKSKLEKANEDQATGESEIESAISKKAELEHLINTSFEELKAVPKKKDLASFLSKAKKENVEEGILKAAPVAFEKTAETRTEFDSLVLTRIGEALQQRVAELGETITKGDARKAELSSAVEAAKQAAATAQENKEAAAGKSSEATAAAKAGEKAVKEAKKAHKSGLPAVKEAEAAMKAATKEAQQFKAGPLAAYAELRDRAAPAEAEEPAEQEPAEEAAMAA